MENSEYFKLIDTFSKELLKIENRMLFPNEVPKTMVADVNLGLWSTIFNQLYADGFIKEGLFIFDNANIPHYVLTFEGRFFIENGGYNAIKIKELEKNKHDSEMKLISLQQIQSVIDTNSSVKQSIINQEKYAKRTILALVVTIIVSIGGLIISIIEIQDNSIQKELDKQAQSLQQISHTLNEFSQKELAKKGDTLNVSLINGLSPKTK